MRISQQRTIVFSVAIYWLVACRLGHICVVYSVEAHILHLHNTHFGCSATTFAAPSTASSWAAYAQEAPSAPDRTPPLAIYIRFCALFLF